MIRVRSYNKRIPIAPKATGILFIHRLFEDYRSSVFEVPRGLPKNAYNRYLRIGNAEVTSLWIFRMGYTIKSAIHEVVPKVVAMAVSTVITICRIFCQRVCLFSMVLFEL